MFPLNNLARKELTTKKSYLSFNTHIDGFVEDCSNSIAKALE